MQILTTEELRGVRCDCDDPRCTGEIYFHGACHPHAATWTAYDGDHNCLTIECAQCGTKITRILLTPTKSPESNTGDTL
jgi:hypothetical protein